MSQQQLESRERMFGVECRVGRLVEGWAIRFDTVQDVELFGGQAALAIADGKGPVVICSDYTNLTALLPEVFTAFEAVLRRANPRLERAALIMPREGTGLRRQMDGLMRKAVHPSRRLCADFAEARAWLGSALAVPERARLEVFLRERQSVERVPSGPRRAAPKG